MSQPLDFSIPRSRLALLSASFAISLLLLYAAGVLTGVMLSPRWTKSAQQELTGHLLHSTNRPPAIASPLSHELKTAATPIALKPGVNSDLGLQPAQLAVQVASFNDRIRAQSLADSLKRQGFPSLSVSPFKSGELTLYSVRLGPYTDWDTASRAAAEVQHSYDVRTLVRPL